MNSILPAISARPLPYHVTIPLVITIGDEPRPGLRSDVERERDSLRAEVQRLRARLGST